MFELFFLMWMVSFLIFTLVVAGDYEIENISFKKYFSKKYKDFKNSDLRLLWRVMIYALEMLLETLFMVFIKMMCLVGDVVDFVLFNKKEKK